MIHPVIALMEFMGDSFFAKTCVYPSRLVSIISAKLHISATDYISRRPRYQVAALLCPLCCIAASWSADLPPNTLPRPIVPSGWIGGGRLLRRQRQRGFCFRGQVIARQKVIASK